MKQIVFLYFIFIVFFFFVSSCSSSNGNTVSDDSTNDSIINVQLRSLVDSALSHNIRLHLDSFSISNSLRYGDTIKMISGDGFSGLYKEILNVSGSYKVSRNLLTCISLEVSHRHVGNVFVINDTITSNLIDTLSFSQLLHDYYKRQDEIWQERKDLTINAYSNRTKVHFGISRDEYNSYGEDFQRNFYEGLVGYGAYELSKPIFSKKNVFVGFDIMEIHDNTFSYSNVQENAELVKHYQIGYDAHESFRSCYYCSLYNMEIISRYDKFDRKTKHSLKCYWNEHIRIYDRY